MTISSDSPSRGKPMSVSNVIVTLSHSICFCAKRVILSNLAELARVAPVMTLFTHVLADPDDDQRL